ncbi:MAG: hypothetical protein Q4G02_03795, partial [bacterium]|nr:hypothetical protein [bacterium]
MTKLKRIILLTFVDCLFAILMLASLVQAADQQETDFRTQCSGLNGYVIKSDSSSACPEGQTQLASVYLTQQWINIFCCEGNPSGTPTLEFELEDVDKLKKESLAEINPLKESSVLGVSSTPGDIINRAMETAVFPIAGIALFILILLGGFQMVTASFSGKANYVDLGKNRI